MSRCRCVRPFIGVGTQPLEVTLETSPTSVLAAALGLGAPYRCVVLGPRDSGRSVALASMVRTGSCVDAPHTRIALLSMEEGREVLARARAQLRTPPAPAEARPELPAVALRHVAPARGFFERERPVDLVFEAPDRDGAALFQDLEGGRCPAAVARAVRRVDTHDGVIFCLDAGDRRAGLHLRRALDAVEASEDEIPTEPLRGAPPPVRRVLLLLNKVDRLVSWVSPHASPVRMAGALDPLNQAEALVGAATLRRMARLAGPRGQVAVGLCAGWGFCERTGLSYWDQHTGVHRAAWHPVEEDELEGWRPFGVREALLFLARGQSGGALRTFRVEDLSASGYLQDEPTQPILPGTGL